MRAYITAIPACVAETLRSSLDIGRTGRGHARRIEVFGQSREHPPLQHAAVRGVGPGHRRHRRQRPGKGPQARAGIRARLVAGQHISRLTLRIERMVFAQQAAAPDPAPLVNGIERRFRPPGIARRKRHALPAAGDKPAGGKGYGKESLHRFGLFAGPYAPEVRRRQVFISTPAPRRPYGRTSRPSRPASATTSRPVFPHP